MKRLIFDLNTDKTIATVTLNRPEKHNGVDWMMLKEIRQAQKQLKKLKSLRAVVINANGPSFCAGLDFKSVLSDPKTAAVMYANLWMPFTNIFQTWSVAWRDLGVPVIAQVHGNCFGAGMQLALGADIRVATPDAKLSLMEAKWGLIPDMGGAALLKELVRVDQAKEIIMTGRVLTAEQAKEIGMVTHIDENPAEKTQALLNEILSRSPDSVAASKFMLQRIFGSTAEADLTQERRWQRRLLGFANQRLSIKRNSPNGAGVSFTKRHIQ